MISIFKHGNVPIPFAICWHCGCEFTYDEEDVKKSAKGNEYIVCPDCKDAIGLYNSEHEQDLSEELFDSYEKKRKAFHIETHWKDEERERLDSEGKIQSQENGNMATSGRMISVVIAT